MQFADVKNDVAFRKIFGNENKKEILISFLNAVLKLEGTNEIDWVEMLNPFQLPRIADVKSTVLDLRVKDRSGNFYIVEMQVTDRKGLDKRIQYYSAKAYAAQLASGDFYDILKPIIFICILNFDHTQSPDYLSRHIILNSVTHEHKLKDFEFTFIELPKFNKKEEELTTLVDKWVFFIKNAKNLQVIPQSVNDDGLKSAYLEAARHTWSRQELDDYDDVLLREMDDIMARKLYEEKADEKAMVKAMEKARKLVEEAEVKAMEKAMEKSRKLVEEAEERANKESNLRLIESLIEFAKRMIKRGNTDEIIMEDTGLTIQQIQQLREEMNG